MARRLPPLNALRAFEAGARHLSFTKAARELHVTQAAVSHQVKTLEEDLGVRLFRRFTRRLALTEEGRALQRVAGEALESLAEAAEALRAGASRQTLTVSLTPTFGSKWLARRLGRFWGERPDIDLRLHHSNQLVDFARDEVDVAVRWGRGAWPGLEAVYLMRAGLSPVCSPALLDGPHPLREPADLRHHTLLHERDYEEWTQWLTMAGVHDIDPRRGQVLDDPNVLHQATIHGQGLALASDAMVAEDVAAGRLVTPFDLDLESDCAYYVVAPRGSFERPVVKAFRDFLLDEAAAEPAG
jgi:LysR family glycine cleavage system transcriptional activator